MKLSGAKDLAKDLPHLLYVNDYHVKNEFGLQFSSLERGDGIFEVTF